ncbi:MAG: hemoglobin [Abditibacteriota bacterium]|nr:hemoglobin [Abditibacteriota bacterium]
MTQPIPTTLFEAAGGTATFERIIDNFYNRVQLDAILRPMYQADLSESKRTMTLFLIQYWGGPGTYSQERGHPRLRMRHAPFSIGQVERDAWMSCMTAAVQDEKLAPEIQDALLKYFEQAASFMMNR